MPFLVNGEHVDDALIRQEANLLRPRLAEAMADDDPLAVEMRAWEWARENVIERVLLRQAAFRDPAPLAPEDLEKVIGESPAVSAHRMPDQDLKQQAEAVLRVDRLIAKLTANVPRPTNTEIADFYRKHRDSFYAPELAHAAHVVKNVDERTDAAAAQVAIEAARGELRSGRSFEEVADEYSDCPGRGGDLGWFPRGQMVDEFDAVVFELGAGEVSEIFRSPFGFHIAKLYERRPAGTRPLHEVRDEIERGIHGRRRDEAVEKFIDELRAAADIRKTSQEAR